jgi:hypothetical protein
LPLWLTHHIPDEMVDEKSVDTKFLPVFSVSIAAADAKTSRKHVRIVMRCSSRREETDEANMLKRIPGGGEDSRTLE